MNSEIRRISSPTVNINDTDKSLHQFRSLRVAKAKNIIRSTSIILETSESPEIRNHAALPQRPSSCGSLKIHTCNKTLSRNHSRHSSKKSITKNDEKLKRHNSVKACDLNLPNNEINSNINRSLSNTASRITVREQYWSCCLRKWTRRERILIIIVTSLIIIVLGLVIVIGIISRKADNEFVM